MLASMDDPELAEIRARKLRELMAASGPKPVAAAWPGPLQLTDATFDGEVGRPGLLLVDFWAEWCGRAIGSLRSSRRSRGPMRRPSASGS